MKTLSSLFFIFIFIACSVKEQSQTNEEIRPIPATNQAQSLLGVKLYVNKKNIKLQSQSNINSETLELLKLGESIYHTGNISEHTTPLRLQGKDYEEPWLEVQTPKGNKGWVYAGGIEFDADNEQSLKIALTTIRLQTLFGKELTKGIYDFQRNFDAIRTARSFERCFLSSQKLRDQLITKLSLRQKHSDNSLPDLFWLNELLPGYILQLTDDGAAYRIYADFKEWNRKTLATKEKIDNEFIKLCFQLHPADSIEYDYKSWFIQTWEHGGNSLLGRGVHLNTLAQMDSLRQKSHLFEPFYQDTKTNLLEDIINPSNSYWEEETKILAELDSILSKNYSILEAQEIIALQARREMFSKAEELQIPTNQRAGDF